MTKSGNTSGHRGSERSISMDISENRRRYAGDQTLRLGNSEAPSQSSLIASTSGGSTDEGERFHLLKRAVALSIFTNIGANFGRAFRLTNVAERRSYLFRMQVSSSYLFRMQVSSFG